MSRSIQIPNSPGFSLLPSPDTSSANVTTPPTRHAYHPPRSEFVEVRNQIILDSVTCPNCKSNIIPATSTRAGADAFIACTICVLLGCIAGCCLIPFFMPECQVVDSTCPNCKVLLYSRPKITGFNEI